MQVLFSALAAVFSAHLFCFELFSSKAADTSKAIVVQESGADPWILQDGNKLYYTQTTGANIAIWSAADVREIGSSTPAVVWPSGRSNLQNIWAPELHKLNHRWYIYFSADKGLNHQHRLYVLESVRGPLGPYSLKGQVEIPGADFFAIDATVFRWKESMYLAWSGWDGEAPGNQNIYLAELQNPWTVTASRTLISRPVFDWEGPINEGPQFLTHKGKAYLIFSANRSWTDHYSLGALELIGEEPASERSWRKVGTPIFQTATLPSPIYAPGHCTFFTGPNGQPWMAYHVARSRGSGWDRQVRAQAWYWSNGGTPSFGEPLPISRAGSPF